MQAWGLSEKDRQWHLLPHKWGNPLCGHEAVMVKVGDGITTDDPICWPCRCRVSDGG